jgi:hypothetical protein
MLSKTIKIIGNVNFELENVPRDGSCIFHCKNRVHLGFDLNNEDLKVDAAMDLRKVAAEFMREKRNIFDPIIETAAKELFNGEDVVKQYIDALETDYRFYSGEEAIIALANSLQIDISVYNGLGKVSARHSGSQPHRTMYWYFENLHYSLIQNISFVDALISTKKRRLEDPEPQRKPQETESLLDEIKILRVSIHFFICFRIHSKSVQ